MLGNLRGSYCGRIRCRNRGGAGRLRGLSPTYDLLVEIYETGVR